MAKQMTLANLDKKLNREEAKAQGFFDGRFRNRVVKDKKKEQSKRWAKMRGDS